MRSVCVYSSATYASTWRIISSFVMLTSLCIVKDSWLVSGNKRPYGRFVGGSAFSGVLGT